MKKPELDTSDREQFTHILPIGPHDNSRRVEKLKSFVLCNFILVRYCHHGAACESTAIRTPPQCSCSATRFAMRGGSVNYRLLVESDIPDEVSNRPTSLLQHHSIYTFFSVCSRNFAHAHLQLGFKEVA